MRNVYSLINNNLSSFLTMVRDNVRAGHYIQFRLKNQREIFTGKITYISSDYIYVDKIKVQISIIQEIKRVSKKEAYSNDNS